MAKIRVNRIKNFTIVSNTPLKCRDMSLKAKGLLCVMMSLPDDWVYSINGLVAICKENETAINTALKELKRFGYVKVTKEMPTKENGGRIEYIYDIYPEPQKDVIEAFEKQQVENQGVENQGVENQGVENQGQLNKEKSRKENKENNKENIQEKIANDYNIICLDLPKVTKMTEARKKKVKTRLKSFTYDQLLEAFKKAQASDFVRSGNWCNFDWITKSDENVIKLLEGNYDNKGAKNDIRRTSAATEKPKLYEGIATDIPVEF